MKSKLARYVVISPLTVLPLFGAVVSLLRGQMFSAVVWGAIYLAFVVRSEARS